MSLAGADSRQAFVLANTSLIAPPHVPEIRLHLASEAHELWKKTEAELVALGLDLEAAPPFWAFAWAGGQALARYVLDHPQLVSGKRVLDLATGSGLVAIAAAMAGARQVTANDIDPWCEVAVALNAQANRVSVGYLAGVLTDDDLHRFEVILAGDVAYDRTMTPVIFSLLSAQMRRGARVLVGDPGRNYLPKSGLEKLAEYQVPVSHALEDSEVKRTCVWELVV